MTMSSSRDKVTYAKLDYVSSNTKSRSSCISKYNIRALVELFEVASSIVFDYGYSAFDSHPKPFENVREN